MNEKKFFLGHPIGLFILFFTESFERFSYYGMRSLLIFYLTQHLLHLEASQVIGLKFLKQFLESILGPLSVQPFASEIYGLYTGLVYLGPLIGGTLADKKLGRKKTIRLGASLMAFGHFLMISESLFLIALTFLIIGNGLFKPNTITQVSELYEESDPRRESGFTLFYLGINLGAFFSPLICGTLGQSYGWHYGFSVAGIGMLLSLMIYSLGEKFLPHSQPKLETPIERFSISFPKSQAFYGLLLLCAINTLFWSVYEQIGNTLGLFVEHQTVRTFLNWEIPSTWFFSINPLLIFLFAPILNRFWHQKDQQHPASHSIKKIALGSLLLTFAFISLILFILVHRLLNPSEMIQIHFFELIIFILLATLGELHLSPVSLSLITRIAPPQKRGQWMGIWMLSLFLGNIFAGHLGTYYHQHSVVQFFLLLATISFLCACMFFSLRGYFKKVFHNEPIALSNEL